MASVKRRGDLQWQARIRRRGHETVTRTFETEKEARAWAAEVESQIYRSVWRGRSEAERMTLEEALLRYQREITPTKRFSRPEHNRINRIVAHKQLSKRYLASIRSSEIANFRDHRATEDLLSPNSIRLELAIISHLFKVARSEWGMEGLENPVEHIRKPKLPQGRDRRLDSTPKRVSLPDGTKANLDEEARLLMYARDHGRTKVHSGLMEKIIITAIETAMRRSEIAGLTWPNVDLINRVAHLPETKNGSARDVPLSPRMIKMLTEHKVALEHLDAETEDVESDGEPDPRVFRMTADSISQGFAYVCEAAGIKGLTFHDLRHEATSRLFEKNLGLMEVASITGHRNLQMLKRYTHLRAKDLAARLDSASRQLQNEAAAEALPASRLELTEAQAIQLSLTRFWREMTPRDIATWQLCVERMVVPIDVLHESLEAALGREVEAAELVDRSALRRELLADGPEPTREQLLGWLPINV